MNESRAIASVLSLIAPLFSYLSEIEYRNLCENASSRTSNGFAMPVAFGGCEIALALPSWEERSTLQNDVLVAGMPFSAMPVESLYKKWSDGEGNAFGAARGLYLGDPARHMMALYEKLNIEVPREFASMPDHLALELELLSLLLEAGNGAAAREFAADHLDWLADYDEELASRAESVSINERFTEQRRRAIGQGIAFLRELLGVVERATALLACDRAPESAAQAACAPA